MNPDPFPVRDSGTQVMTPYVIRDSVVTAYVALTTGTKTELVAGVAGYFLDLMQIHFANTSTAAQAITLFDESTTVQIVNIPLSGGVNIEFPTPLRQSAKGAAWYIDNADVTTSTVNVQALFVKRTS